MKLSKRSELADETAAPSQKRSGTGGAASGSDPDATFLISLEPPSRPHSYAVDVWDVLTWHHGTLAIAWWAVIVLIIALLSIGGASAARRK